MTRWQCGAHRLQPGPCGAGWVIEQARGRLSVEIRRVQGSLRRPGLQQVDDGWREREVDRARPGSMILENSTVCRAGDGTRYRWLRRPLWGRRTCPYGRADLHSPILSVRTIGLTWMRR